MALPHRGQSIVVSVFRVETGDNPCPGNSRRQLTISSSSVPGLSIQEARRQWIRSFHLTCDPVHIHKTFQGQDWVRGCVVHTPRYLNFRCCQPSLTSTVLISNSCRAKEKTEGENGPQQRCGPPSQCLGPKLLFGLEQHSSILAKGVSTFCPCP